MKQIELSNFSISNDKELTIIGGMNVLESHSLAMQVAEHFKKVTEKLKPRKRLQKEKNMRLSGLEAFNY